MLEVVATWFITGQATVMPAIEPPPALLLIFAWIAIYLGPKIIAWHLGR